MSTDEGSTSSEAAGGNGSRRHYPPGVFFHVPHCMDGGNALAAPIVSAVQEHPNFRFHFCVDPIVSASIARDPDTMANVIPYVVMETVDHGRHPYAPSDPADGTPKPPDAIRPPCRVCRGTHEGEA